MTDFVIYLTLFAVGSILVGLVVWGYREVAKKRPENYYWSEK